MNLKALAKLRPGMPASALEDAMGDAYTAPSDADGWIFADAMTARLTGSGTIGELSFRKALGKLEVLGLSFETTLDAARALYPALELQPADEGEEYGWTRYKARIDDLDILLSVRDGKVGVVSMTDPNAVFGERETTRADPSLTEAFDLELTAPVDLTTQRPAHGWCYGLPPAIGPERWPMSPTLGIPLRHAFTIVVPEAYRAQNEHLVALSLFVDDQFEKAEEVGPTEFHANDTRTFLMHDVLGCVYVAIWLTAEELAAPLGAPPPSNAPWMTQTPSDYYGAPELPRHARTSPWATMAARESLNWGLPIVVANREGDPNIGKPAREWAHENEVSGYVTAFSDRGKELNLERFYGRTAHLGGTMFPIQGYPDFTPYYLELEEHFGGFNFGGGCGQLDLKLMKLDWACG